MESNKLSWGDFLKIMQKNGCSSKKGKKNEMFYGGKDPTAYPHIHLWSEGKNDGIVALSASKNTNPKIGDDDEINLKNLEFAQSRVKNWDAAPELKKAIETVLSKE